jgi:hypothetical protein
VYRSGILQLTWTWYIFLTRDARISPVRWYIVEVETAVRVCLKNKSIQPAQVAAALPRNEAMYFNGQQWGSVVCWNPYSSNCNNAMAIVQGDSARVTMFETPYLYDMLDGQQYPLLADGDFVWNDAYRDHLQDQNYREVERWHPGDRG